MANDTSSNPWAIDTAGVITTQAVRVRSFRWDNPSGQAGDDLIVKNNAGAVTIKSRATGANYEEAQNINARLIGINVDTIDRGTLFLFV